MKKTIFPGILATTALCLAAVGVSSCLSTTHRESMGEKCR